MLPFSFPMKWMYMQEVEWRMLANSTPMGDKKGSKMEQNEATVNSTEIPEAVTMLQSYCKPRQWDLAMTYPH